MQRCSCWLEWWPVVGLGVMTDVLFASFHCIKNKERNERLLMKEGNE